MQVSREADAVSPIEASHVLQTVLPTSSMYAPSPPFGLIFPTEPQSLHAVEPATSEKRPTMQLVHCPFSIRGCDFPKPQIAHNEAVAPPTDLYPAGHKEHALCASCSV